MPWYPEAMKDAVSCDKRWGAAKQVMSQRFLNGETRHDELMTSITEYIGNRSERGELKHLSTLRNRIQ